MRRVMKRFSTFFFVSYLLILYFLFLMQKLAESQRSDLEGKTSANLKNAAKLELSGIQFSNSKVKGTHKTYGDWRLAVKSESKRVKQNDDDDFSYITLKPETAVQLKAAESSEIKYAVTIGRSYLLENPRLCANVKTLTVIVIVHSAINHFEYRKVIRETWTNKSYYSNLGNVKVVFLLGKEKNGKHQLLINNEFNKYGDIVQGDFIDDYNNMTHKNVMGYKWLTERCRNAKVVLKVDDDVVINMFYFMEHFVPFLLNRNTHMSCVRLSKITVKRYGKWAVNRNLFKENPHYPDYCQGFMVAISNDVIPALYQSASITPFFWIDDVFAYGMVTDNIPGMQYTGLKIGTDVAWNDYNALSCYQNTGRTKPCSYFVVLVRGMIPQKLRTFWRLMVQEHDKIRLSSNLRGTRNSSELFQFLPFRK